jgi:hypothetical protein
MGRKKKSTDYIDNDKLKELVTEYVKLNYNDKGDWIQRYENTMKTRCIKKPEKWPAVQDFINRRKALYDNRGVPSMEDIRKFEAVQLELVKAFYKIAEGVLVKMSLIKDEEREDIMHEEVLAALKYCNRFDEALDTSCFAYITQCMNNAVILYLDDRKKSKLDGNLVYEHEMFDTRGTDQMKGMEDPDNS